MYVASVVWTLYMLYVLLWCGHCIRVVYSICRVDTILGVCSTVVWTLHLMYAVLWCGHYTCCMQYCGVNTALDVRSSVVWTLYLVYAVLWCGHCILVVYSICGVNQLYTCWNAKYILNMKCRQEENCSEFCFQFAECWLVLRHSFWWQFVYIGITITTGNCSSRSKHTKS